MIYYTEINLNRYRAKEMFLNLKKIIMRGTAKRNRVEIRKEKV
jgi:hypothetical protein